MNFAGKRGRVRGRCPIRHIRGKLHLVSNNNHRHSIPSEFAHSDKHLSDKFRIKCRCHFIEL